MKTRRITTATQKGVRWAITSVILLAAQLPLTWLAAANAATGPHAFLIWFALGGVQVGAAVAAAVQFEQGEGALRENSKFGLLPAATFVAILLATVGLATTLGLGAIFALMASIRWGGYVQ